MHPTDPDPLAAALLPVTVHGLNNATQLVASLNAVLAMPDGGAFLEGRADDLSSVSTDLDGLGWIVAVLASASGSDLMLARRKRDGLPIMIDCVRDGLRREGRDLAPTEGSLPALAPGYGSGWEVAWAVGVALYVCGQSVEGPLAWTHTGARFEIDASKEALPDELVSRVHARLVGGRLEHTGEAWRLDLPEDALEPC